MKKKINDINIPIKMSIKNLTKDTFHNQFNNTTQIDFSGEIILEAFGEKERIGIISTDGRHETIAELMKEIKSEFLSHVNFFKFDVRGW